MNEACILCNKNLIKGPIEDPKQHFDVIYQKCDSCGSYGYWKKNQDKIKNMDQNRREKLLKNAKSESQTDKTPVLTI